MLNVTSVMHYGGYRIRPCNLRNAFRRLQNKISNLRNALQRLQNKIRNLRYGGYAPRIYRNGMRAF